MVAIEAKATKRPSDVTLGWMLAPFAGFVGVAVASGVETSVVDAVQPLDVFTQVLRTNTC